MEKRLSRAFVVMKSKYSTKEDLSSKVYVICVWS
jgi:hypothetical protein